MIDIIADTFATRAATGRRTRRGGCEMDAFSRSYRRGQNHDHEAGDRAAAKVAVARRDRRATAAALRALAA